MENNNPFDKCYKKWIKDTPIMDDDTLPQMRIKLNIEKPTYNCIFQIVKGEEGMFEFVLTFSDFCQLANDMQKVIKEINLELIKEYEQRKNEPTAGIENNVDSPGNPA